MQEQNILNGGIDELNAIRSALEKRDSMKEEIENIVIRSGRLEGDIAAEKKITKNNIDDTISKRIEEVGSSFDKEINEEKGKLRAAKGKRDKAKNKGIRQRIEDETQSQRKAIKELDDEIKTEFRSKGVPSICNTFYYYAMYCAGSVQEWLVLACSVLVFIVGIPCLLYGVLDWFWLWKIILDVVVIAVFLGIYITVWLNTRDRFGPVLLEMRGKRDAISEYKKEIRKIKREIKKDEDESRYNLGSFDEEIKEIETRIKVTADKKRQALEEFDKNTRPVIEQEITDRNKEKIQEMENELEELTGKRRSLEISVKDLSYDITSSYEAFIGKEYMSVNRIDELASVINGGNATNIIEAVNYIKEHQLL